MKIKLIIIYCLFVGIILHNHFCFDPLAEEGPKLESLNDVQEKTLSLLNEMTNLLISLATALLGAIGFIRLNTNPKKEFKNRYHIFITAAFCCSAISIDFGYIYMEKLTEQLYFGSLNPYERMIEIPRIAQIIFFILGIILTGCVFQISRFNNK